VGQGDLFKSNYSPDISIIDLLIASPGTAERLLGKGYRAGARCSQGIFDKKKVSRGGAELAADDDREHRPSLNFSAPQRLCGKSEGPFLTLVGLSSSDQKEIDTENKDFTDFAEGWIRLIRV